jgi:hypothetical protein
MNLEEFQSIYNLLKRQHEELKEQLVSDLIQSVCLKSYNFLRHSFHVQPLTTNILNKSYFSFTDGSILSRPINRDLFETDNFDSCSTVLFSGNPASLGRQLLQKTLYTAAISFCAFNDLHKKNDQKTPGTFFEIFSSHFFAKKYEFNPEREIQVLNLDLNGSLPTDYIFRLGNGKSSIHLPVKTSTRERVIQVWAHQRVLDGIYGVDRFKGVLVCLAETNAQPNYRLTEVCLPKQWQIYQSYIARLHRIYYLDLPSRYADLVKGTPSINVKEFSEFFFEYDDLVNPLIR